MVDEPVQKNKGGTAESVSSLMDETDSFFDVWKVNSSFQLSREEKGNERETGEDQRRSDRSDRKL